MTHPVWLVVGVLAALWLTLDILTAHLGVSL